MLIAVASKDGKGINQHFGHADRFLIYNVEGEEVKLVAEKVVEKYCSDDPDHQMRRHLLSAMAESVKGCRAIVCAQIGQAPQMEMERLGVEVFTAEGPIEKTISELAKVL